MPDTRQHVVEDAISDLAIGPTDVTDVSPFGYTAHPVVAAEFATPESAALIVRHTSGFTRPPAAAGICRNLPLPQMLRHNENRRNCLHRHGGRPARVGTGVGARDRSHTRPGHLPPLLAQPLGLTVVDLRDRVAFRRTASTAPVESAQARGRAGVAR
jgi:3,4-dihydroxy-2-butanone 4-phosphate synthase